MQIVHHGNVANRYPESGQKMESCKIFYTDFLHEKTQNSMETNQQTKVKARCGVQRTQAVFEQRVKRK